MYHSFDVDIAVKYGINAAVILHNIAFWCAHSKANGTNYHDGLYWTYNSVKAFQELFPYLGKSQISGAIQKLLDEGLIVKGNYNKAPYDRTAWYAVTRTGESVIGKSGNATSENQTMQCQIIGESNYQKTEMDLPIVGIGFAESRKPIPDSKPDNKPDNKPDRERGAHAPRFTPPTVDEVKEYAREMGYSIDADRFVNFYESKGWVVGRSPMRSWKAAIRNWAGRERQEHPAQAVQHQYADEDDFY